MKEKQFWNRILEFAQERLTRSMYDFYATPAELIKVEENTATIFLPRSEMEMVWEKAIKRYYYCYVHFSYYFTSSSIFND